MKKILIILALIIAFIATIIVYNSFDKKPKKRSTTIYIRTKEDSIKYLSKSTMTVDKYGNITFRDKDSPIELYSPLNGHTAYRYYKGDSSHLKKEVFLPKHNNPNYSLIFNNDTIKINNEFFLKIIIRNCEKLNCQLIIDSPGNYKLEKEYVDYRVFKYNLIPEKPGIHQVSGRIINGDKSENFVIKYYVYEGS